MTIYLYPLLSIHLYVPVYDNLDSSVIWYKILAHSGEIFAPNTAIIPNMMNGLPRASYGSEFDLILWLYYFFEPQTAYRINELLIHIIAFSGAYMLLSKYIVPNNKHYKYILIYSGTLYFALLPFWSGSGASIASLPLTTYILLNIKNKTDNKWHWLYLIMLPLYSSFILVYMFYIIYAGIYWIYDAIRNKQIDWRFMYALVILGVMFLLKEYRLIYSMFIDSGFTSHRIEFDVFFSETLFETYRLILVKFLQGHTPHAGSLQQLYIIPISLIALFLSFYPFRLNQKSSLGLWLIILLSFYFDLWHTILINRYILPLLLSIVLIRIFLPRKHYKEIAYLLLIIIIICFTASLFQYNGLKWLSIDIPLLKSLNIIRLYFVEPLLFLVLIVLSFNIFIRKLDFSYIAIFLFISVQFIFSLDQSFYKLTSQTNYLSFKEYYAPDTFQKIKQDIIQSSHKGIHQSKVISYGLEPAVALYNGLYTIDGYSANYPIEYKKKFKNIISKVLDTPLLAESRRLFEKWGSKLYILSINSLPETYRYYVDANISAKISLNADTRAICKLHADYIISAYELKDLAKKNIYLINHYKGSFWRLWLYKIKCDSYHLKPKL